MSRPCKACGSVNQKAINQRLRSGTTIVDVARWLDGIDDPIGRNALSRHQVHIGVGARPSGPRPPSKPFLEAVRDAAHEDLDSGILRPTLTHGIAAEAELSRQKSRDVLGKDWQILIVQALTGQVPQPIRALDAMDVERAELEAELRPLLEAGALN